MTKRQKFRLRCQRYWRAVKAWLIDYGFAGLVLLAFVAGMVDGWQTQVPPLDELPGLAFGSDVLYRREVGGISFIFYYLMVLAFVLALNGRGFTEIGPKGVRDGKVVNRETQETIKGQEQSIEVLTRDLEASTAASRILSDQVAKLQLQVAQLQQRIDHLEK